MPFDRIPLVPLSSAPRTALAEMDRSVHGTPADRCSGRRTETAMQAAPCDAPGGTILARCCATR